MAVLRASVVEEGVSGWYGCTHRCVRHACLTVAGRPQWIGDRLDTLAGVFAVRCPMHVVADDRLYMIVHAEPERAVAWSGEEVVRRWARIYPQSTVRRCADDLPPIALPDGEVPAHAIAFVARQSETVDTLRRRLAGLDWYMRALKQPLARQANLEDGAAGHFWESRFACERLRTASECFEHILEFARTQVSAEADAPARQGTTAKRSRRRPGTKSNEAAPLPIETLPGWSVL